MTYKQKLLDPRWQKKRLAILDRDNFECQYCDDAKETLHVHHKKYSNGNPWEIGDEYLITLCANCHKEWAEEWKTTKTELVDFIDANFTPIDARHLLWVLTEIKEKRKNYACEFARWEENISSKEVHNG